MTRDAVVDFRCLLVLELIRIELECFLEAIDRFAIPVAIEVAEAEVIDGFFVFGIELDGVLE